MRRLDLGVAVLMVAAAALAADQRGPEITPPSVGEDWLRLSSTEKLFWSIGYAQGYQEALNKIDVSAGPNSACAGLADRTERSTSTAGKASGVELVSRGRYEIVTRF